MPIQNRDYYGAAQRGRVDALDQYAMQQRNALGRLQVDQAKQFNALAQNPQATADQYARIGRSDVANALTNQQSTDMKRQQIDNERLYLAAQYGIQAQSPKAFIAQNFPEIAALNPDFANESDEQVRAGLQDLLGRFGAQAGVAPPQPAVKWEERRGPRGSILQVNPQTGEMKQVVGPDNSQPAPTASRRFRPMTPQEVQGAGLPPGTAAQVNDETGQISILSKRDATANLSQKDATTAKQKLVTVQLAKQQLERIRARFEKLKGSMAAGAFGQGRLPTEAGKSFDAAVDQMRSTLTALTRTPGVGAMSDYETKLDQAKFPARTNYESVTEEQIQAIDDQLTLIDRGYRGLLEGSGPVQQDEPEPDLSQLSDDDLLRALSGG